MRDRYRYRRRTANAYGSTGHSLFGSTGWLFADLLLALALVFLLATTVGAASSPVVHTKPTPSPTATKKPPAKPGQPEPALDLNYVTVSLSITPGAISASSIKHSIMTNHKLKGQRAGLVILFAGGPSSGGEWGQIDSQVWSILRGMNDETPLFKVAVSRQFWDGTLSLNQVRLNVYLFKTS